jgi:hypothetical protein
MGFVHAAVGAMVRSEDDDAFLERELNLAERGIELVKMEGRVFLRFSGEVKYEGLRVRYALVPWRAACWPSPANGARWT